MQCNMLVLLGEFYRSEYNGEQPCKVCVGVDAASACAGNAADMAKDMMKGVAGANVVAGAKDATAKSQAKKPRQETARTAVVHLPAYTLHEVNQHRLVGDAWAAVGNRVLDITAFIPKHPGGDVITLAAGIDATILFHTYHPNGVPASYLEKLTIGRLKHSGSDSVASVSKKEPEDVSHAATLDEKARRLHITRDVALLHDAAKARRSTPPTAQAAPPRRRRNLGQGVPSLARVLDVTGCHDPERA